VTIYNLRTELTDVVEIKQALKDCHDSKVGGHQGIAATTEKIERYYVWPSMTKDIREYVENCSICKKCKPSKIKKIPMKVTSTSSSCFARVIIDLVGPFKETPNGSKYVLSMMCDLSRYVILVALPDATAESVARGLSEKLICVFSAPSEILSDRAQNFLSKVMQCMCKLFKIKKVNSTAWRPQTQAPLERYHASLGSYLRCFNDKIRNDWDTLLPYTAFAFNTKVHASTGFTPFEIVFGKAPNLPLSLHRTPEPVYNYDDVVTDIKNKHQTTWAQVKDNLELSKIKTKQRYDKNTKERNFMIGELVWLKKEARDSKLDDHWSGPYAISEINSPENVTIIIKNKPVRVHVNRIKKDNTN
jgi:Integrase zinc binding domain/Integrase core domain